MQLRYSPTSPYVRKVLITAIETDTTHLFEKVPTGPWDATTDLRNDNPLCKVPALVLDTGESLFDSPVICEYLDSLHQGPKVFPESGLERFMSLRMQALADGIMDAAILRRLELARPQEQQSESWLARQQLAMQRGVDDLQAHAKVLQGPPHIGAIASACALAYLDFRYADEPWRGDRDALANWFDTWCQRQSMLATQPPE